MEIKRKQTQISELEFKELSGVIKRWIRTNEGHFGQFTHRGDFWPKCPLNCDIKIIKNN